MTSESSRGILDALFTTEAMAGVFSDHGRLQGMLDFEAALARAQAGLGIIPERAPAAIEPHCRAERYDPAALAAAAAAAGNPAIPLVRALTEQVAGDDPEAARYVHWGATSQDVMDTGLVLQIRHALVLLDADLRRLCNALAELAERHQATPMVGRTWLQQAVPITFGLKAAGWLGALERCRERLAELRPRVLSLQLGGAAGTLSAFGERGPELAAALAEGLELNLPELPWHTQRDRLAEMAAALGLLVGSLGKMARDISLLMQTEVGEAVEPAAPGRGGSTAMPQKHNPVGCAVALTAALRVPPLVSTMLAAMPQAHERGLGDWQAEWETLPEIFRLAAGALRHMREVVEGVQLRPDRMRANLEAAGGLVYAEAVAMALAPHLGRAQAHALVERACRQGLEQGRHLRETLAEDPQVQALLSAAELDRLFDPAQATGPAERLVARVLAARGPGR